MTKKMKAKEKKLTEALYEMYRRSYAVSTPVGDFDKLLAEATLNEKGQKIIPFENYECEEDVMDKIVHEVIKEYKIKGYNAVKAEVSFWIGCSPMSKRTNE
jgi:hypothetical protein